MPLPIAIAPPLRRTRRRSARALVAATLALALPALAHAEDRPRLVAVLPLQAGAGIEESLRNTLEEEIRTVSGDLLAPFKITVLNGENTLKILADNGLDPEKACEASCALEAARELNVEIFVSGTLNVAEEQYVAFVRLSETKSGRQLGSVRLEGAKVRDLRQQFVANAPELFGKGLGLPIAQRPAPQPAPKPDGTHAEQRRAEVAPAAPRAPTFALRAGAGTHLGIVGIGFEAAAAKLRERSLRVAVGTGTHALSGGVSWAPEPGRSGFYVDAHATWVRTGPFGKAVDPGIGFGATVGAELFPVRWLGIKAGLGLAYTTTRGAGLALDLCAGPVF